MRQNHYLTDLGINPSPSLQNALEYDEVGDFEVTLAETLYSSLSALYDNRAEIPNLDRLIQIKNETGSLEGWLERCILLLKFWLQAEVIDKKINISAESKEYSEVFEILAKIHPYLYLYPGFEPVSLNNRGGEMMIHKIHSSPIEKANAAIKPSFTRLVLTKEEIDKRLRKIEALKAK